MIKRLLILFAFSIVYGVAEAQVYEVTEIVIPAQAKPFHDVQVSFDVALVGGATTSAHIKIYQHPDNFQDAQSIPAELIPLYEETLDIGSDAVTLSPTIQFTPISTFSPAPIPQYFIVSVSDDDFNTADVVIGTPFEVLPLKDIIIRNLQLTESTVSAGDLMTDLSFEALIGTLVQDGNNPGSIYSFNVFLSEDQSLSTGDVLLVTSNQALEFNAFIPIVIPMIPVPRHIRTGEWHLIVVANYYQTFAEEDYNNNTQTQAITIEPAKLPDVVTNILAPITEIPAGSPVSLTVTLANAGDLSFNPTKTKIILSNDDKLDSDDIFLKEETISIGETSLSINIPEGTDPGEWFLFAVGDSENSIDEGDENNNESFTSITVVAPLTKDLQFSSVVLENIDLLIKGSILNQVTSTIKNDGSGATIPFTYAYFLSDDQLYSSGDIPLGEVQLPSLAAGESKSDLQYGSIPDYVSTGQYYLLVVVDSKLDIVETLEDNNIFALAVTVQDQPLPDLTVVESSVLVTPLVGSVGFDYKLSFDLENIGNEISTISSVSYYLSEDDQFDGEDFRFNLESVVFDLVPGQIVNYQDLSLTLPKKFSPGAYKLFIKIDYLDALVESDETNNMYTADVSVVVPDYVVFGSEPTNSVVASGTSVTLSTNIKNISDVSEGISTNLRYFLSTDETFDALDVPLLSGVSYTTAFSNVPNLGPTITSDAILSPPLLLSASLQPNAYFVIVYVDSEDEISEVDNLNNTLAVPITITYPNLSLTDMVVQPFNIAAGGLTSISVSVRNTGDSPFSSATINYYFSVDNIFDEADLFLTAVYVDGLEPGTISEPNIVDVSMPLVAQGQYRILAIVDPANVLAEKNENDNQATFSITITNPDLQVQSIDPTPEIVGLTEPLNLKIYIKNTGNAAAAPSRIGIYLSKNETIDDLDYYYSVYEFIPLLAPSATSDPLEYVLNLPSTISEGLWNIIVVSDMDDNVLESNEDNNVLAEQITISVPDLIVANQFVSPSTSSVGSIVKVSADIKNTGSVRAPEGMIAYFLSDDDQLSDDDYGFGQFANFPTLEVFTDADPQASFSTVESNLVIPSYYDAGNYFILIQVDPDNFIAETNEVNNIEFTGITITIPDFSVPLAESLNANVGSGGSFTLRHRVSNESATADAPQSLSGVYLSLDNTFSQLTDSLISTVHVPAIVKSTTSVLLQPSVFIPDSVKAGTYTIFVKADHLDFVNETNETNNVKSFTINVTNPDLTLANLTPSKLDMGAGELFTVNVDVQNIGSVDASSSMLSLYLSKTEVLDDESLFLTLVGVDAIAKDEFSALLNINVAVPYEIEAGDWYLVAVADDLENLAEADEENNIATQLISIQLPDLEIFNYAATVVHPGVGGKTTLTLRVRNNGFVDSPASKINYYLSSDKQLDQQDIFLGDTLVAPVEQSNTTDVIRKTITLPYDLTESMYTVLAMVDADSILSEIAEDNNLDSTELEIIWPDLTVLGIASDEMNVANGQNLNVYTDIHNAGLGRAPLSMVSFFFSKDEIFDIKDTPVGQQFVDPLEPQGQPFTLNSSFYIPPSMESGNWYLIAIADKSKAIPESDETNNELALQFTVVGPDLFIRYESVSPTYVDLDQLRSENSDWRTLFAIATVANNEYALAEPSTFAVYLSEDQIFDKNSDEKLVERTVPYLTAGTESTFSQMQWVLREDLEAKMYYLLFVADVNEDVDEFDEQNNIQIIPFEVRDNKPDLNIEFLSVTPTIVSSGLGTQALLRVTNKGESAAAPHKLNYYLSTDGVIGGGDDIFLASTNIAMIEKNSSVWQSDSLMIPAGTPPGVYNLLSFVDAENEVSEKVEANVSIIEVEIRNPLDKDLEITSTSSLPEVIHAGSDFLVSAIVENNGLGKTKSSALKYYLSSDGQVSGEDIPLSALPLPGLSSVDMINAKSTILLPTNLAPAQYNLLLFVDADEEISETDESNNVTSIGLDVQELLIPDLEPVGFTLADELRGNASSLIALSLRNAGSGRADGATVSYYLSRNSVIDIGDFVLGSSVFEIMGPHTQIILEKTLSIPDAAGSGYWYLLAKADVDNVVNELKEDNNLLSKFLYVEPSIYPDLYVELNSSSINAFSGEQINPWSYVTNAGSITVLANSVKYYLSSDNVFDNGDIELANYPLEIIYPYNSALVNAQMMVPEIPAGNYYLITVVDPDNEILESNELNNTDVASFFIQLPPKPNLAVSLVENLTQVGANSFLNFDSHIQNVGPGYADIHFVTYYLSTNLILDGADRLLGFDSIPSLSGNQQVVKSKSLYIPANVSAGVYYVIATTDANSQVEEINELDNQDAFEISVNDVLLPDLTVVVSDVSPDIFANGIVWFTQTIKNIESGTAATSGVQLFLSKNQIIDTGDIELNAETVPVLKGSSEFSYSNAVLVPATVIPGDYYLIGRTDGVNAIEELDETNNLDAVFVNIGAAKFPDLVTLDIQPTSPEVNAGKSLMVRYSIANLSTGASGQSFVKIYLSADGVKDGTDLLLSSQATQLVSPESYYDTSAVLPIPMVTAPGDYTLIFIIDEANSIAEDSEANNTSLQAITVKAPIYPDLFVSELTPTPSAVNSGKVFNVNVKVSNQGEDGSMATTAALYLSTDNVFGISDILLKQIDLGALSVDQQTSINAPVTIAQNVVPGNYFVIVRLDDKANVTESDETNNSFATEIEVLEPVFADLSILSASGSSSELNAGLTMTVFYNVKNGGEASAQASANAFYLSIDNSISNDDILLAVTDVSTLAADANAIGSVEVSIASSVTPGPYFVIVAADDSQSVQEEIENNNTFTFSLTVLDALYPDLVVTSLTSLPNEIPAGENATMFFTVKNIGEAISAQSTTELYLSSDNTLGSGDVLLKSSNTNALAVNAINNGSTSISIPISTLSGAYFIVARTDAAELVQENNESNNVFAIPIIVLDKLKANLSIVNTIELSPESIAAGQGGTINFTVANNGEVTSGSTELNVILSSDLVADASDLILANANVAAILHGTATAFELDFTIPVQTVAGAYHVLIVLDEGNQVDESDEDDNEAARSVVIENPLPANLTLSETSLSTSETIKGASIDVFSTLTNGAQNPTRGFTVRIYLSANQSADINDAVLKTLTFTGLDAGASVELDEQVLIPNNIEPGNYFVVIVADVDNLVIEGNKTDNTAFTPLEIILVTNTDDPLEVGTKVYPNPVRETLSIRWTSVGKSYNTIRIVNMYGQAMFELTPSPQQREVDVEVSSWTSGMYLIQLTTDDRIVTRKVLKQ